MSTWRTKVRACIKFACIYVLVHAFFYYIGCVKFIACLLLPIFIPLYSFQNEEGSGREKIFVQAMARSLGQGRN